MRLTKKREDGHYDDVDECVSTRCSDKLGKVEDIEELCEKIMRQPLYRKHARGDIRKVELANEIKRIEAVYSFAEREIQIIRQGERFMTLPIGDYGKTWALTKDELNK